MDTLIVLGDKVIESSGEGRLFGGNTVVGGIVMTVQVWKEEWTWWVQSVYCIPWICKAFDNGQDRGDWTIKEENYSGVNLKKSSLLNMEEKGLGRNMGIKNKSLKNVGLVHLGFKSFLANPK